MNCLDFDLLESILYEPPDGFFLLDKHLSRLKSSALEFSENPNYGFFKNCITDEFIQTVKTELYEKVKERGENTKQRVRLTVNKNGDINITCSALDPSHTPSTLKKPLKIKLDTEFTCSKNIFLRHKTTNRKVYDEARKRLGLSPTPSLTDPIFDTLLFNEKNQITECSISNIAVEYYDIVGKSTWKTPEVDCGLLSGVMRKQLIDQKELTTAVITIDDIKNAQLGGRKIKCFNSVRKEFEVILEL